MSVPQLAVSEPRVRLVVLLDLGPVPSVSHLGRVDLLGRRALSPQVLDLLLALHELGLAALEERFRVMEVCRSVAESRRGTRERGRPSASSAAE